MLGILITILFFLSGACGLVYEVVWLRMLGLILGSTVFAASTVLSSYMAGLALGSFFSGRIIDKKGSPLKVFAMLEAGVGISALMVPLVFRLLEGFYANIHSVFHSNAYLFSIVRFIISFIVLLVPTTLMGATLPVLSRYFIKKFDNLANRFGILYGINTLGAVAGCFAAGFILIEKLGVTNTIILAAVINIAIALAVLLAGRNEPVSGDIKTSREEARNPVNYSGATGTLALIVMSVSGFCALSYEVLWSRVLVFFFTSNTYAFSMMLIIFLAGISIGSFVFGKLADRSRDPLSMLGIMEVLIGIFGIMSVVMFARINAIMGDASGSWAGRVVSMLAGCGAVMFLPAFLMGGAFPVAGRIYIPGIKKLGASIGNLYSINTLGGIIGSVITGFVLIPVIGIQKVIILIGIINLVIGSVVIIYNPVVKKKKKLYFGLFIGIVFILTAFIPSGKPVILYSRIVRDASRPAKLMYYKEDITATVSVIEVDGDRKLNIDGFNAAGTKQYEYMRMLGHLPLLLCRNPENVLVLCFGTGTTCGSIYNHGVKRLDCVEISPAVVDAGKYYRDYNYGILEKERFNLIVDDGRNYLLYSDRKYDVITTEPMHPYLSGAVNFYSKDFYELCRKRLTENGVMCQWAPMHVLSKEDYNMVLRTFREVFPHSTMWFVGTESILIGTNKELSIDFKALEERLSSEDVKRDLAKIHHDSVYAILDSFVMDESSLAEYTKDSKVITDDRPVIEFSAPRNLILPASKTWLANIGEINRRRERVFPLLVNTGNETLIIKDTLERYFQATNHVIKGQVYSGRKQSELVSREFGRAFILNPGDRRMDLLVTNEGGKLKYFYFHMGDGFRKAGSPDNAILAYKRVLEIDPGYARAHNGLALAYNEKGMYDESIKECLKAIELDPGVAAAYGNLGIVYLNSGYSSMAEESFRKAISIDAAHAVSHYYLGIIYREKGLRDKAERKFKDALRVNPGFKRAKQALDKTR